MELARLGAARPRMRGLIAVALFIAALSGSAAEASHNLLLITLDTFRADYLGANGSSPVPTPNLDRLARGGANFTRARAPVPLTLPSHASLLTGLYPPAHGLRDNGGGALGEEQLTLAEVLREEGYETAAFVASFVLDHRFGLAQGFTLYDDRLGSDPAQLESPDAERDGAAVLAAFERWLGARESARPFFAWVHLFDPHAPYEPPEPHRSRYQINPYAGEIAYSDEIVGRILTALGERGLAARTLVAVAGDHGEGLGEHRESTHGLLIYNSTLHVPMLLHAPGLVPAARVDRLVRLIDLAPTLLDYLGLEQRLGEGVSLRPLIESAGKAPSAVPPGLDLTAYAESLYGRLHLGWSPLFALEAGRHRFILAPEPELFDLAADPGERANRAAAEPQLLRDLHRRLAPMIAETAAAEEPAADEEQMRKLRSLGYLSGRAAPSTPAGVADPKSKMEVWERLQRAIAHFASSEHAEAASILEELRSGEPEMPILYEYLGASYMRLERWEEAEHVYRAGLERGSDSPAARVDLGLIQARRGEPDRAEREFLAALTLDPKSVPALHHLADLHRGKGKHRQAIARYREALAINPDYVYAWNGLALALAAAGEPDGALAALRTAIERSPRSAPPLFNLAAMAERQGRRQEALAAYERFLELSAGNVGLEMQRRQAAEAMERLRLEE